MGLRLLGLIAAAVAALLVYWATGPNTDEVYLQNRREQAWAKVARASAQSRHDLPKACKELQLAERNYREYTQKNSGVYRPNADAAAKCERL